MKLFNIQMFIGRQCHSWVPSDTY